MTLSKTPESLELYGTVKLTYEEFQRIPYDGLGHHLLEGVHIVTPAPSVKHQKLSSKLFTRLSSFVEANNSGIVLAAPVDVKFSPTDGYQPDLVFVDTTQEEILLDKYIDGAPALVIELTSPDSGRADYGWKKNMAEKFKVQEYWVVDMSYRLVEVFSFSLSLHKVFSVGEILVSNLPALRGFEVPVEALFD